MVSTKQLLLLFSFLVLDIEVFPQSIQPEDSKTYQVGYTNIVIKDSSRIYKNQTLATDPLHYRPHEIDLWYPANNLNTGRSTIKFVDFLNMLQERFNRFQDDTVYKSLSAELVQYINLNLQIRDSSKLLEVKTNSYDDPEPIHETFPLILYYCAFNGMAYENIPLFEKLASHGYIVASITSVGRYPGNMTTKGEDLMEQVQDGIFALQYLKSIKNVDSTRIGAIGYSWGGLAAVLMASRVSSMRAVISLDGSEMIYYHSGSSENEDFNGLRDKLKSFSGSFNSAYTYLESGHKQDEELADSIYSVLPFLRCEKKYLKFAQATHEDFSVIPSLGMESKEGTIKCSGFYDSIINLTTLFFDQYLKETNDLFSKATAKLYSNRVADSAFTVLPNIKKPSSIIKGKVIDAKTKEPVAYVNIGIPNKNIGTVSGLDGTFAVPAEMNDSIGISMIGYESKVYLMNKYASTSHPIIIELDARASTLHEVTISAKLLPTRKLGNTTTSHFFNIGLPLKFLGSEIGIVIRPGKKPVWLKSFQFNISENHLDSAVFRFNIYSLKHGQPFENILHENILLRVGKEIGPCYLNLSNYKIVLMEDVLISLEWIDGGKSANQRGVLFLSASLLNSSTWHRTTSLGKWSKAKGLGVGFNVDVQPYSSK